MGYTYILRHGHCYRNTFFYPHGACFTLVYPGCFSFYVYVCAVCYCVCLVLPCGVACFACVVCVWCIAVAGFVCDRVSGFVKHSWSGRVSWVARCYHADIQIILPYNTKHYYYGRTRYRCTDCLEVRYVR